MAIEKKTDGKPTAPHAAACGMAWTGGEAHFSNFLFVLCSLLSSLKKFAHSNGECYENPSPEK